MEDNAKVLVVIVGFRNALDILDCLRALAGATPEPDFDVFVSENGGSAAMDALVDLLSGENSPCEIAAEAGISNGSPLVLRRRLFRMKGEHGRRRRDVHVAEMAENLGYAGAINAWLRSLMELEAGQSLWQGVWILNPDTKPAPSALAELVAYASSRQVKMVGSRLVTRPDADYIHSYGLAWRKLAAKTLAVGYHARSNFEPNPEEVEKLLDAPSGASCYATWDLIEEVGLMKEHYFLFYEDLDWGARARRVTRIGYAHRSVVLHSGGSTIGVAGGKSHDSPLGIFLDYRNRILFVRTNCPRWLWWTVVMQLVHLLNLLGVQGWDSMKIGCRGLLTGLFGISGRPDEFLKSLNPESVKRQ